MLWAVSHFASLLPMENLKNQSSPRRSWLFILLSIVTLAFVILLLDQSVKRPSKNSTASMASQLGPKDVIGDLGGMKVTIPRHVAEFVEYDGDPGWSGKQAGEVPSRTPDSKLMSFGFRVRFPDMATLSSKELWADRDAGTPRTTKWLDVGVTTGSHYPGDGFMDRSTAAILEQPDSRYWFTQYEELPQKEFDLSVYIASGVNPKTGKPYREHDDAEQIFVSRNLTGKVLTRINCSHRGFQPCTQSWSLENKKVQAKVYVSYTRPMLEHWQEIQTNVTQFILELQKKTR